jgi:IS4 transposase
LRLLERIPAWWLERFSVRVLADSGFDSDEFIDGVHNLGLHGVIGSRANRVIGSGRHLRDLCCKGCEVQFRACETPVFASWFKLKRARQEHVWRYVISTRRADGETIRRWGRRRWRIEAFFKTLKFRFGLDQFGQQTTRGAFRFIVLGLLAFRLTFWEALETVAD